MKISRSELEQLYRDSEGAFYLLFPDTLKQNYRSFMGGLQKDYPNSILAYSYKTNYTPYICELLHGLGAWAEVVSDMEYAFALKMGISPDKIIVNGPVHTPGFMKQLLENGSVLNIDGWYMLTYLKEICLENPEKQYKTGIRFNFKIADGPDSRFGFQANRESLIGLKTELAGIPNLTVFSLHCHFSTSKRSLDSFAGRLDLLIDIYENYFADSPIEIINTGGGFFSNMPESLRVQFEGKVPALEEYAHILGQKVKQRLSKTGIRFVIEPGTAIAADSMQFVTKVVDIKNLWGKQYLVIDGSVHNVKPTMNPKNIPFEIPFSESMVHETFDIAGYTCMETDIINRNIQTRAEIRDLILFHNVGGYTNVFKPPFIQTHPPIYAVESGNFRLIKRKESPEDILNTYIIGNE